MKKNSTTNQEQVFARVADKVRKGEKVSVSKEMRESGVYSESMSKHPEKLTTSKGWQKLLQQYLPDSLLSQRHHELLNATSLDHMTFPPFREKGEETTEPVELDDEEGNIGEKFGEQLTDKEIRDLLSSVNCMVRKIVHGDMARHVYFWSSDNKARKEALDMAYKLKGNYAPEKLAQVVVHIDARKKAKIDRILGIN